MQGKCIYTRQYVYVYMYVYLYTYMCVSVCVWVCVCVSKQDPLKTRSRRNGFRHALERDSAGWSTLCYAAMQGDPLVIQALRLGHLLVLLYRFSSCCCICFCFDSYCYRILEFVLLVDVILRLLLIAAVVTGSVVLIKTSLSKLHLVIVHEYDVCHHGYC